MTPARYNKIKEIIQRIDDEREKIRLGDLNDDGDNTLTPPDCNVDMVIRLSHNPHNIFRNFLWTN